MESDTQAIGGLTDNARGSSVGSTSSPRSAVDVTNRSITYYSDHSSYEGSNAYSNASKGVPENYEEESGDRSADLTNLGG
eukprot:14976281-Ditylum_brightwellii.AAC.1